MSNSKLSIKNLSFSYENDTKIFSDISFEIEEGKIVCIIGANGSGKTTLLKCIAGIYQPDNGNIYLNGTDIKKNKQNIYLIESENDLFEYLTIEENIYFFLRFYNKKIDTSRIEYFLERYNLSSHRDKYIYQSSKGMLKKTQIIISLLLKCNLLIADEPMEGLDKNSKDRFSEDLRQNTENDNSITIVATHGEYLQEKCNTSISLS